MTFLRVISQEFGSCAAQVFIRVEQRLRNDLKSLGCADGNQSQTGGTTCSDIGDLKDAFQGLDGFGVLHCSASDSYKADQLKRKCVGELTEQGGSGRIITGNKCGEGLAA